MSNYSPQNPSPAAGIQVPSAWQVVVSSPTTCSLLFVQNQVIVVPAEKGREFPDNTGATIPVTRGAWSKSHPKTANSF